MTALSTETDQTEQSNDYIADTEITQPSDSPPGMYLTGEGYEYFRCQAGDNDETVYVHQLLACLDHDPHLVFGAPDVKFAVELPWLLTPDNLYLSVPKTDTPLVAHPDDSAEDTRAGIPLSEYERLVEADVDGAGFVVSNNLRDHMEQYRRQAATGQADD